MSQPPSSALSQYAGRRGIFAGRSGLFSGKGGVLFSPSQLPNLAAWFRFNTGITGSPSVSAWADQSGNGRDLLQASGPAQPQKQGDGSILFDGVAQFLKCNAFTLNQPFTVYLLAKQVTWSTGKYIFDGNVLNNTLFRQRGASPQVGSNAGVSLNPSDNSWTLGTYMPVACVFNGVSSVIQINNGSDNTGDVGAQNAAGFTLGAGPSPTNPTNIQVKEVIIYSVAHDATTRGQVNGYLAGL